MSPDYRITAGALTPEELAALTVVLSRRTGTTLGPGPAPDPGRRTGTRWRRLGPLVGYQSPTSWR